MWIINNEAVIFCANMRMRILSLMDGGGIELSLYTKWQIILIASSTGTFANTFFTPNDVRIPWFLVWL